MSSAPDLTSRVVRHERLVVASSIALLAALSWSYLATGAGMRPGMAMQPSLATLTLMWWVMMAAMMLPSATPAILLYARVRQMRNGDASIAATWLFLAGYLAIWLLFSVATAPVQLYLNGAATALNDRFAEGAVLIGAGLYQLSPLKRSCLRQCRSPAQFLSRHWRAGWYGAARLGVMHGAYCVGCCWALMTLLFVGGVMNLLWVVALATIVAVEKLVPRGDIIGRAAGIGLIAWGLVRLLA